MRMYAPHLDTTLILKVGEKTLVGIDNKIDFPWDPKNIYSNQPEISGIQKHFEDSTMNFGYSEEAWRCKKGSSNLTLQ